MGKPPVETIIEKYGSEEAYKEHLHKKLSGKHFWTNGVEDRKFSDDEIPPKGWWRGRTNSGKGTKGYVFINNGTTQTQIPQGAPIPEGFTLGALPFTDEHKSKISVALKGHVRTDEHNENLRQAHRTGEYKEKLEQTNLQRYGVKCVFASDEIKRRIQETNIQKYGYSYASSSPEIRQKVQRTCLERYGIPNACQLPQCRNGFSNDSGPNRAFAEKLDTLGISYEREFSIGQYSYDFKVENTLIEINPTPTHNSSWGIYGQDGLDKYYHQKKSQTAINNGYRCIHIFDWDDPAKILNMICISKTVYARKCEIREVSLEQTTLYLNTHHLQNSCKGQTIRLGLYYNNELVSLMTFGNPRYNKKYEWELLRYCSTHKVIGGAEKLFSYFVKNYAPKSIISYCDKSKFNGDVYVKLGFQSLENAMPSKHWYNMKSNKHITDNLLRQRGFDQLFKSDYGKGTSNEELMLSAGFVEIYDCGQETFIYK